MSVVKSKKSAEEVVAQARSSVEDQVRFGTEAAQRGFEQAASMTREQFDKASKTLFKNYEEFSQLGKENIDAFVKSGTIFARGFEEAGKSWIDFTRRSLETSVETAKAVMGCRDLREVVDVQSDFARNSFDRLMNEGTKLSEIGVKVANEALEPIQSRLNVAVEKIFKPAAA
jgi:phasin family protein